MRLPHPRGPLSARLLAALTRPPHHLPPMPAPTGEPLDDEDLHLSLAVCYELHNGGVDGIDDRWEWEPSLLAFRAMLEERFERALRWTIPTRARTTDIASQLWAIRDADSGPSLSEYIATTASPEEVAEFVVHRSFYQLREADPHSWAIARLRGDAKAALVMVQADEYGGGITSRMHSSLFRNTMVAFELDATEGAYVDHLPGSALATTNLMFLLALNRRLRGAIIGHLAMFEMTSTGPNRRYGDGLRRLGFGPDATEFFDEHVTADAVHEHIAVDQMATSLARAEPAVAADILFGAEALLLLEARWAGDVLRAWAAGSTSLRVPLVITMPAV